MFAVCVLRSLAKKIERHKEERDSYLATASAFEEAAVGLLEQCADSSEELSHLLLVRCIPLLGGRTVLKLARSGKALKFVASPACQVILNLSSVSII